LGFPTGPHLLGATIKLFRALLPGRKRISARGVSHFQYFYFVIVLLSFFTLFLFASFYKKYKKKLVPFIVGTLLLYFYFIILTPEYVLKDLSIGSGSVIGKDNIEEFFNHVSKHKDVEDRSLAELAPSYEIAVAYLVYMLEARFVNLNPIIAANVS
jgi:hypothetical protein